MHIKKISDEREGLFVTRPSIPPLEEYVSYLERIWDKDILTNMGPLHEEFREKVSDYLGVDMCLPTCNGHMALELAIQALGLKGEIITTPYTFASTTHAIVRNGCTPVFCDIRESDCTIDTELLESLITDKTSAILPVHVYGMPCNVEEIQRIADKHGLKVIYDAAHAFGVRVGDRSIAAFGDAAMFSFHATKSFNTIEGGCVCVRDMKHATRLYQLCNFGIMGEEEVLSVGANAKMNEFQAAMGLCNLVHFEENRAKRKALFEIYRDKLSNIEGIRMLTPYREDVELNYSYCAVFFDEQILGVSRDRIYDFLADNGVYSRKYFYPITSDYECYKDYGFKGDVTVSRKMSRQVLSLPLYANLSQKDAAVVCNLIKEIIEK